MRGLHKAEFADALCNIMFIMLQNMQFALKIVHFMTRNVLHVTRILQNAGNFYTIVSGWSVKPFKRGICRGLYYIVEGGRK